MQGQRMQRVNDLIHRVLAEAVGQKLRDPRLGFVTIMGVETSSDLKHARVRVSVLGSPESAEESVKVLNHAAGFLRAELRREVELRAVPELQFVYDPTLAQADRIDRLLRESARGEDAAPEDQDT